MKVSKRFNTSLLEFSSRKKSNTLLGGTGSQKEVAALSTIPGGLPGSSMLFRVMTRTSSGPLPDMVVHVHPTSRPKCGTRADERLVDVVDRSIVHLHMFDPSDLKRVG
ncbi:fatty acyl-ACP thioesterases B [Striga asiatica]|uniref:Fatty acyl-ACP thioesterases B n=1 Tax=Striga asiatica TaxID=4170 RepID=A0A5A7QWC0_STRAF|nr:fatty acyl-ACP thioesterases B [Striga asiatica]